MDIISHNDPHRPAFLQRIPADPPRYWRGACANLFLDVVRKGTTQPPLVLKMVAGTIAQRLRLASISRRFDEFEKWAFIDRLLDEYPEEALGAAQWALAWERLSPAEKAKIKAERAKPYVAEHMAAYPPTRAQLWKLGQLGVATAPTSRLDASKLIDGRMQRGDGD